MTFQPPRDNLVRASAGGFELRGDAEGMPTIHGHGAVFNQWTRIDSLFEGTFMERIAPGAFRKTIAENRPNMRMLFNHGQDPTIGDKPIAPIEDLAEDSTGLAYSGRMLDTTYNADLIPGLRAGLYGSPSGSASSRKTSTPRLRSHPTTPTPCRSGPSRRPRYSSSARSPSRPIPEPNRVCGL